MRWSSLLIALLLILAPATAHAEGVRPDQIPVVAPDTILIGQNLPLAARTLCTDDPTVERRWEVRNLTGQAITFTWEIVETGQSRTITLTGGARVTVSVPARSGKLTLRLLVDGNFVAVSPNWGTRCAAPQPGRALTWRNGVAPKAPTRPAKPRAGSLTWRKGVPKAPTRPAKPRVGSLTWRKGAPPKAPTRRAKPKAGQALTWRKGAPPKAPTRPASPRAGQLSWRKGAPPKAPIRPAQPVPGQGLTWQQKAPPQQVVQVTPICYRQPSERRWRVQNLTDAPLTLTMEVEGKPRGELVLAPRGQAEIALEAVTSPNRLRVYTGGQLVAESPNTAPACSP